jgi:formamidopyrimidine-DNA glycosylase
LPELPEVDAYRRLATRVVGRTVLDVATPDPWYVKQGDPRALIGHRVARVRRRGKALFFDTDGPTLGVRFGMTGRLVVDGTPGVDALLYSSNDDRPSYDRFALRLSQGTMVVRDPRRLGGVFIDPDEARLGPDALGISVAALRAALTGSRAPLKARLMDQAHVAGVGNLVADEALWRARLDPARPAGGLTPEESRRLARAVRSALAELIERGGSHTGDLMPERSPGGRCPRDATPLARRRVGGRTTWSCPLCQS